MDEADQETESKITPDIAELGEMCGATAKQVAFAAALLEGHNYTEAAHLAGYAGERGSVQLRSAGSGAARAKPVQALLALAESRGLGVPNAPGDFDELKRILWTHARSKDKAHSIKASTELMRLAEVEQSAAAKEDLSDPIEILAELAKVNPDIAGRLAAQHGLPLDFIKDSEARTIAERKLESLAITWIRDNATRARELADFWLRPSNRATGDAS
jgi:hypothetical protein